MERRDRRIGLPAIKRGPAKSSNTFDKTFPSISPRLVHQEKGIVFASRSTVIDRVGNRAQAGALCHRRGRSVGAGQGVEAFLAVRKAEIELFAGASPADVVARTRWRW